MERYSIQTHSDIESNGKICGIETKHFVPILCALFASLILFLFLSISAGSEISIIIRAILGFSPLILTIAYVFIFFIGRVPHFQEDFFENLLSGANFNVGKIRKDKNPLLLNRK